MPVVPNDEVIAMFRELKQQNDEIKSQNNHLVQQFEDMKLEFQNYKKEVKECIQELQSDNEILKKENGVLRTRLLTAERKLKKFNLVIYGLKSGDDVTESLIKLFHEKLGIVCREHDFRDTYKIGVAKDNKEAPIVVEFVSSRLKNNIITNAKKLKGTGVYISVDYTSEDYSKRKLLISQQKLARERGYTAYIKGHKLVVNGNSWSYEDVLVNNIRGSEESPVIIELQSKEVPKKTTRAASRSGKK